MFPPFGPGFPVVVVVVDPSLPGVTGFSGVVVAVRNLCYNYLRDKKKTIDFSQIELSDKQLSFQEQLIQEETYRLISNAIAELPVQSGKIMQISAGDRSSAPSQN